jgi:ribosomal protein S27E
LNNLSELKTACKGCGAKVAFKPGTNHLTCEYCGADNEIEIDPEIDHTAKEIDLNSYLATYEENSEKIESTLIKCHHCGAETTFDSSQTSGECAFCDTPLVMSQAHTTNTIKPSHLLPFRLNREKARAQYQEWLKSLWFAPNDLTKRAKMDSKLKGVYLPFWTYDCETSTRYTGQRGTEYQVRRTRTGSDGKSETYYETKVRWSPVSGRVFVSFDDVLVSGTRSLPRDKQHALEPWDLQNLQKYDERYLAGFITEQYQVNLKQGYEDAKGIMDPTIRSKICSDIGGDRQRITTTNTSYTEAKFKHIILPTWVSAMRYKEELYQILVNARTGEVQGQRPWSYWKIAFTALLVISIIGTIWAFSEGYIQV